MQGIRDGSQQTTGYIPSLMDRIIDKWSEFYAKNSKSKDRYMKLVLRTKSVLLENITEQETEFREEKSEYRS